MGKTLERDKRRKRRKKAVLSQNALRAKRRRGRKRIVILQRVMAAGLCLAAIGGIVFLIFNIPSIKLNRELYTARQYTEEASYQNAIEAYEAALKIDATSVEAYRCMAGTYLDMEDESSAKQILFEGWESTQDEGLLEYYCTVVLNEAVAEINENKCSLNTVLKIVNALEKEPDNADALELMDTAYEWLIHNIEAEQAGKLFYDETEEESCQFELYKSIIDKLTNIYGTAKTEQIRAILVKYSVLDILEMMINRKHLEEYAAIVEKADSLSENGKSGELSACLNKEKDIQNTFAAIFTEFDAGNYEAAKDFIITEEYTKIRDEFIGGTMEYWRGETYIPVSRENVIFKQDEGKWTFEYPDFKQNENTAGIITVWGNKMEDSGVQRSCIAYEPAKESETYYPHMEYTISYMNSNVQKESGFKEELNYHLETRTWTEDGAETVMIGDWGGPYEWTKTY